jgi:hypothetical protein
MKRFLPSVALPSCLWLTIGFGGFGLSATAADYPSAVLADGPIAYWRFNDTPPVATNSGTLGVAANGTYTNGASVGAEAPRPPQFAGFEADNTALQLDGVDDFVASAMGLINNLTNVTISGWLRRGGQQQGRTGIWGQNDVIEFGYIDNNTVQAWVDNFQTPVNVSMPFPDGEWDHLALVVDGDHLQMAVYTNAQLAGTAPLPNGNYSVNTNQFVIGGDAFGQGVTFNGQIDEVALFNKALSAQQIANHYFSAVPSAPIITQQPQGTNLFEGGIIRLSVGVIGSPTLRYQWLYFGGSLINQTNATLVITNAAVADGGSYSVRIENDFGSVESDVVEVDVMATVPPTITQEPASLTRYATATAKLTVVATGGSRLRYQWQRNLANVSDATNAMYVISNLQAGAAGDYRVVVSNSIGSVTSIVATLTVIQPVPGSYEALVVGSVPLAYWRFNEIAGTTAFDFYNGIDGTYNGGASTGTEAPRSPQFPGFESGNLALQCNGTDAFVSTVNGLLNSTPAFTLIGWMRRATDQASRTGLWGQNDLVEFGYINNNTLEAWTDNGLDLSPNPIPNEQWAQLAIVSSGSPGVITMYVNGAAALSRNHVIPPDNNFGFNIGGGGVFDVTGNFFNGQIDELAVFNKALPAERICSLYLTGTGKRVSLQISPGGNIVLDSKPSGTPHNGTDLGAEWVASNTDADFTTRDGVMQFVATEGDQITLAPDPDFNSPTGTITFWMRSPGTVTTSGDFGAMLVDRRSSRGDVIVQADDGSIFVQANDGAGTVNQFSTGAVSDDHWHHIAYVYDQSAGGFTTIYIDGVQSMTQAPTRPWSWDPAQRIELGRSHDGFWRVYDGFMDDFRIYNRILTAAEIAQVADAGSVVDANALKVRFNFDAAPTGITLKWLCGLLQMTDKLASNPMATVWVDVPNAAPPFVILPSAAQGFFRVQQ